MRNGLFISLMVLPYCFLTAILVEVNSVIPSTTMQDVSETVTIGGSGFTSATNVYFGGVKAPFFTILSDSEISAISPISKGPSSIVHVTVEKGGERSPIAFSNRFVFQGGSWIAYLGHPDLPTQGSLIPLDLFGAGQVPPFLHIDGAVYNIAIAPNGARLFALCTEKLSNHKMVVVDIANNQVINEISFPVPPKDMAINTLGTKGYLIYANQLSEIDLVTDTVTNEISLPYAGSQITITSDNSKAYITHYGNHCVTVIDLTTFSISNSIAIHAPYAMAMNPRGDLVYICSDNDLGYAIRIENDLIGGTFYVGATPYQIAINSQLSEIYVINFKNGTLRILDLHDPKKTLYLLHVAELPSSFTLSPDGKMGFVTSSIDNTLTPIDFTTHTLLSTRAIPHIPLAMAITPDQTPIADFSFSLNSQDFLRFDFDASASISPIGTITTYDWVFESDSEPDYRATTHSPYISHEFGTPGDYPVTLTVTNSAGTSDTIRFNGKTVIQNGSRLAKVTKVVSVPWPPDGPPESG